MRKKVILTSFDGTEHTNVEICRPEKYDDLFHLKNQQLIARGAGYSYCNASVSEIALVVDMLRMNRILNFNLDQATITVESGITVGELNQFVISKGYIIPVLPGYPAITVGGSIAFNVHGKSSFLTGTFGDIIENITLFHPEKGELSLSPKSNKDIFELTIGGMGLTGIILTATIRLKRIPGGRIHLKKISVNNVHDAVQAMIDNKDQYEFVYSWNNLNRYGNRFGQGFVYLETFAKGTVKSGHYKNRLHNVHQIPGVQNKTLTKLMCYFYYIIQNLKSDESFLDLHKACFPIYGKEIYYYLFGKEGFREYQALFPFETYHQAFIELEELLKSKKYPVTLGSLKLFSGNRHLLNFNGPGVCLAMDVSANADSEDLFEMIDAICIKYNAIANISKDSRLSASTIQQMYPDYHEFKKRILAFDSGNHIHSDLKKRLDFL